MSVDVVVQHAPAEPGSTRVGVVGQDRVELPGAERHVGGVDPHLVLHGVAAAVGFGHRVMKAGGSEPAGGGDDLSRGGDLDAEVVER